MADRLIKTYEMEGKDFALILTEGSPLMRFAIKGGGKVPTSLGESFSNKRDADRAMMMYKAEKASKPARKKATKIEDKLNDITSGSKEA